MHSRKNWYYRIIFIFVLFILSYLNFLVAEEFYLWSAAIGVFANVLMFLVVIIPFSAYLSDRILSFTLSKNIHKKRFFKFILLVMLVLPIAIVSLTIYNDYKEKNLFNVIGYDPAEIEVLDFRLDGSEAWRSTNQEAIEELFDFLSEYNVKKMGERDWDSDVSKVVSFSFTIVSEDEVVAASIHENRLNLHSKNTGGYYSVINGPVNTEWVASFNEKYD